MAGPCPARLFHEHEIEIEMLPLAESAYSVNEALDLLPFHVCDKLGMRKVCFCGSLRRSQRAESRSRWLRPLASWLFCPVSQAFPVPLFALPHLPMAPPDSSNCLVLLSPATFS